MAGLDGVSARPDVPVCPPVAVDHLALCHHPFPGVADSHQDAGNWWDVDLGAARPVYPGTGDASLGVLRDHLVRPVEAAEKWAAHEPRLADAVPDHPAPASVVYPGLPASSGSVERLEGQLAAVARYKQDAVPSAA